MLIDLVNEAQCSSALAPVVLAASTQGASIDLSNCEISTNAIVSVGAVGANSTAGTFQIEESADGSTNWTAIAGMSCSVTTSNTVNVLRGLRTYKYVRANAITVTGTTPSFAGSVVIVSQKKYVKGASVTEGGYSRSPSS